MANAFYVQHPILHDLPDKHLVDLIASVKDWQINHGSLLKLVRTEEDHTVLARPIGVSLFPSLLPRVCFEEALAIQTLFSQLYASIACDEEWLSAVIQPLLEHDKLASILWNIHDTVAKEGYRQDLSLGVFRSDYMVSTAPDGIEAQRGPRVKQIEFNTTCVAGGSHGNRASTMHQYLNRSQAYTSSESRTLHTFPADRFPANNTIHSIATALAAAHSAYGAPKDTATATTTCILFVVQPFNTNICDERPIQYALWDLESSVQNFRIELEEVETYTSLTPSRELLYHPPSRKGLPSLEVSVVYFRAGLDIEEYNEVGIASRLKLERSRAIKCPSVLSQITGFKKVQQILADSNILQKFVTDHIADRISKTFAPMYPMDTTERGLLGRKLACNLETARYHILKPSLEGGGHNVYGENIPAFLQQIPESQWHIFILMEFIKAPEQENVLISPAGGYSGLTVSELGVFGTCLWRKDAGGRPNILFNDNAGWSLKTKSVDVDEMSVVKGYGCFDSPYLI